MKKLIEIIITTSNDESVHDLLSSLEQINHASSEIQTGAKNSENFVSILMKIVEEGGVSGLISVILSWLNKDRSRSLSIQIGDNSITATNLTPKEQQGLIEWFQKQTSLSLYSK